MKKTGLIFLFSVLTFSAFGQQFLWSTLQKDGEKHVPLNMVTEEVLKFYDHYELYYDHSGYNKERFMEEIAQGFDNMEFFNDITELTVFAGKSNNGHGSFVLVACISEKNVDMIVFSNNPIEGDFSFQPTVSFDREKFGKWFKTLIKDVGDSEDNGGTDEGKALYGINGGSGDYPSLDLAGWRWNSMPNPNDNSNEGGRIVFEIKIDENGDVISVRTLEATVSPNLEQMYRQEVEKLTFSPTSDNPPPISSGKITFIVRSN